MPAFIVTIAAFFGISPLRIIAYAAIIAAAIIGALTIRQHYINVGWQKAMHAIAAKDKAAIKDADDAERAVKDCYARGGTWDQGGMSCVR